MDGELGHADSHRLSSLAEKFHDKRYRDGYVASHTRGVLARQMRNFRGDLSQAEFGAVIGKRQTVVSRLESPAYGSWTLRTMLEIARKKNVAVFCRFVDFPTFLKYSGDLSESALAPAQYENKDLVELIQETDRHQNEDALRALFSEPSPSAETNSALEGLLSPPPRPSPTPSANDNLAGPRQHGSRESAQSASN